ncbi:hypothetical protein [Pedobacter nyackensis]|uniref:DUF3876 domain-containing protein n=1 Tax=Pedobacter nyackensis TaxID=475255 RepID=A0A1W1ZZ40_9SPHI|nr:hypothetical protein [Pedobacter nyackensis]SMC53421.1 hypothetical protein SAMN04488101_101156 [Pedobacter nyackensis]
MKKILLVVALFLCIGCGKENTNPVFNDFPLIGTWISRDGRMWLTIENVKNEGDSEKYYEYMENGRRMLRRTYQNMPETYQILFIDGTELRLGNLYGQTLYFLRGSK